MINKFPARSIRSIAKPPSPVRFDAPFTWNMAPSAMMDKIDEEILDKTPTIRRIPPIVSAKAIGICISTGNPIFVRKPAKPGSNFPDP
ncbi:hypothetical protein LCGC14_1097970 [marine sediment metagenome]|uniref:Uncharacterized protein n=1 Tax=marine sediment metagenome TaxID=412755 RepID=A0A0F9MY85_9ZZZZ